MSEQTNSSQLMRKALVELKEMRARLQQVEAARQEPIAIVGLGCRFPGADGPDAFWALLRGGGDAIREVPADRWPVDEFYDPDPASPGTIITRYGGFVEEVDRFDPAFFGISPREAASLDPQQRLLLEVTWEALENGAIAPDSLVKSRTGVFVGICGDDYARKLLGRPPGQIDAYAATGTAHSTATGRLSYLLGLHGPSLAVDTACSSSLVAVHLAVMSLRQGECDLALAGGSHLILAPEYSINFSRANMLAPDGRCKTFDAGANGYVRGEGCGMVALKRLSDARRDGDPIVALIRGSAVNQDGRTNGLTAPNGAAQQAVIRAALANGGVSAAAVGYVEAHGTGTPLGDPIEMNALGAVFRPEGEAGRGQPLFVGAVKTNVGHLEASAGIAGLIKTALALRHGEIPPNLHFHTPSPHIPWDELPLRVPTQPTPWPAAGRVAGVSAFGFSGTNAHTVLEAAPSPPRPADDSGGGLHWLALSARTEAALVELAGRYAAFLDANPAVSLADICYSAWQGRTHFEQRLAVMGASHAEMAAQLRAFAASAQDADAPPAGDVVTGRAPTDRPAVAFLCTGQGAQAVDMGRRLYADQPLFRAALDRCAAIVQPFLEQPLLHVIFAGLGPEGATDLLDQTLYTQPALFALEYALAQVWQAWGVEPDLLLGHSVGEYVAACLAGVFSLEDGLKLIAARARLMQALPAGGEMVSVMADEERVARRIAPYADRIAIAAVNGPASVVISGPAEALRQVVGSLEAEGIKTRRLQVSHAFHSPLMQPILAEFRRVAEQVRYSPPNKALVSNLTGKIAGAEVACADYWVRHVRQAVRFADGVATAQAAGASVFVEIGPKPTLLSMAKESLSGDPVLLPSLRTGREPEELRQMWLSLGQLYVQGVAISPPLFEKQNERQPARIALPTYPFQRQRYWVDTPAGQREQAAAAPQTARQDREQGSPLLAQLQRGDVAQALAHIAGSGRFSAQQLALAPALLQALTAQIQKEQWDGALGDWLYAVEWQAADRAQIVTDNAPHPGPTRWLVIIDPESRAACALGADLVAHLRGAGYGAALHRAGEDENLGDAIGHLPAQEEKGGGLGVLFLQAAADPADSSGPGDPADPAQAATDAACRLLDVAQSLIRLAGEQPLGLWVVTQGQALLADDPAGLPIAPALWSLGHVIGLEEPSLWGGLIDLPLAVETGDVQALLDVLIGGEAAPTGVEGRIAIRRGRVYVPRLTGLAPERWDELRAAPCPPPPPGGASYLITGGLGGLGLQAARELAERYPDGCHLILMGRRAPDEQARRAIAALEERGARVSFFQGDVARSEDVARLFAQAQPPIRGIIHAAGVLDDGILLHQNRARFERVFAPKVWGSWLLHRHSQGRPLDFFVCFSSAAALFGSPGQSNYSAANGFVDGLVRYRRGLGLPALSIQWGAWSEVGMAAAQGLLHPPGVGTIPPAQGGHLLGRLLNADGQMAVLPMDWARYARQFTADTRPGLLARLLTFAQPGESAGAAAGGPSLNGADGPSAETRLREQLALAGPEERRALVAGFVRRQAATAMRFGSAEVETTTPLLYLGMDSLMAVEIRDRIRAAVGVEIELVRLLEGMSIADLAQRVAQKLEEGAGAGWLLPQGAPGNDPLQDAGQTNETKIEWTEGEL